VSRVFHICAGVRQGGILSPLLFAVYIDGLVQNVDSSGFGCWLHGLFVGCVLYADDNPVSADSICYAENA